jgi:mannose-6-phosphate isomerase-like protein (cupin superfamily)
MRVASITDPEAGAQGRTSARRCGALSVSLWAQVHGGRHDLRGVPNLRHRAALVEAESDPARPLVMECLWVLGQRLDFLATAETTDGHYSLFHVLIPADPPGPLPHTHRGADEFFFVIEGRVEVLYQDAWHPLGPGQFLHVPRGNIHTFRNVTTDAARMLSGFVPSGFERFFRDFGHSARLEDVVPLPVQDAEIQRLKATASQYDMELARETSA